MEQWIDTKQPSGTTNPSRNVPQIYMSAFAIVAHCILCLVTGKTNTPHPQDVRIARQCARARVALDRLPRFLPATMMLRTDTALCNELLWGLSLLLQPLAQLALIRPEVVDEDIVAALESAWSSAKPSLVPWVAAPPSAESASRPSGSISDRLSDLQRDASWCFDPFGMVLSPR